MEARNQNNILQQSSQYDVRAPPRRRAKGDDVDEQPVFLRKAYNMISSCPPEIGGWSDEGDSIVIKDMKAFSEKVIPTAYRHNNFASFVRQLNFYGFRKVRSDSLEKAEWWIFRHPHFLRGQPHLISEIKRSVHFASENTGGKEVSDLKDQVNSLTDKLALLTEQFERLNVVVSQINPSAADATQWNDSRKSGKKRKITPATSSSSAVANSNIANFPSIKLEPGTALPPSLEAPGLSRQISLSAFDFDYFMKLDNSMQLVRTPSTNLFASPTNQGMKDSTMDEDNDDAMSVSFLTEAEFPVTSKDALSSSPGDATVALNTSNNQDALRATSDLACVIESLSPELKERFVDKLAEVMGTQIAYRLAEASKSNNNINMNNISNLNSAPVLNSGISMTPRASVSSMNAPTTAPVGGVQRQMSSSSSSSLLVNGEYVLPSGNKAPEIALPLASAAISAYLISALKNIQSTLNQSSNNVPGDNGYKSSSFITA